MRSGGIGYFDGDDLAFSIFRDASKAVGSTVLENQNDSGDQAIARLLPAATLAVGAWNQRFNRVSDDRSPDPDVFAPRVFHEAQRLFYVYRNAFKRRERFVDVRGGRPRTDGPRSRTR